MTDIIMTMMTNETIPEAVYTYIQRSSFSASESNSLSVKQRGHLTQHQCVHVYLKLSHVGFSVWKRKTYVLGFRFKWRHCVYIYIYFLLESFLCVILVCSRIPMWQYRVWSLNDVTSCVNNETSVKKVVLSSGALQFLFYHSLALQMLAGRCEYGIFGSVQFSIDVIN